jgi:hypothetical protein
MKHKHTLKCLREVGGRLVCVEEKGRTVRLREETTKEKFEHAKNEANEGLHALGYNVYHQDLEEAYRRAREIVEAQGFEIDRHTGRFWGKGLDAGRIAPLATMNGHEASFSFSWHKMPSGRYEVVAYVS